MQHYSYQVIIEWGRRVAHTLAEFACSERYSVCTHMQPPQLEGPVQLLPPPYALNALEPFMSQETLEYHW